MNARWDRVQILVAMACLMLAGAGQAAQGNGKGPADTLDEVTVNGKRLSQMRQDIVRAEDAFFAAYNKLNPEHDYDVHCDMEAPIGTRIKQRVCRVAFFERAQADEAQALLGGYSVPSADTVLMERSDDMKKSMLAVINAHPELRRMIRVREDLEKKYLATRKERFKGHWILFE